MDCTEGEVGLTDITNQVTKLIKVLVRTELNNSCKNIDSCSGHDLRNTYEESSGRGIDGLVFLPKLENLVKGGSGDVKSVTNGSLRPSFLVKGDNSQSDGSTDRCWQAERTKGGKDGEKVKSG